MPDLRDRVLRAIDAEPADGQDGGATEAHLRRLCTAACGFVPVDGASVNVMTASGARGLVIASDDVSRLISDQQVTLGEGPGFDAYASRHPILAAPLDELHPRWPAFVGPALAAGVHAVFAFPLQLGAARVGVLITHRRTSVPLSADELARALTFAEIAFATLLDGEERRGSPDGKVDGWHHPGTIDGTGLDSALAQQAEVHQAQGMIAVQLGVSLAEATARLRAYAFSKDEQLTEVARAVVARQLRLDNDAAAPEDTPYHEP